MYAAATQTGLNYGTAIKRFINCFIAGNRLIKTAERKALLRSAKQGEMQGLQPALM